nr:hypothetical protein [uncultured Undibacterium sp.]
MTAYARPVDLKFHALLYEVNPLQSISIPCEITFPEKIGDRPCINFYPERPIVDFYHRPVILKLQGQIGDGIGSTKIVATGVSFGEAFERNWGEGLDDRRIPARAESLQITKVTPPQEGMIRITFYLSDSYLLSPNDVIEQKYDGCVTNHRGDAIKIDLIDGLSFKFENEYKYRNVGKERTSWPTLTAAVELPSSDFNKDELLSAIDDFLLLVSFAESRRIACLEMQWHTASELVHEYRMNRAVPQKKENHSFNDCLIDDRAQLTAYLQTAFVKLRRHPQYKLVLGALAAITSSEEGTISTKFIRIFSALESMVLVHRRIHNLELSIPDEQERQAIVEDLRDAIKSNSILKADSNRRKFIYENIPGLFRISLKQAAEHFFEQHKIFTSDIWPIFGKTKGISLIEIRNKIAHGENFSREEWWYIAQANKSLQLLATRCLLSTLGTSYENSRAHSTFDQEPNWKEAQRLLSQHQAPLKQCN